MLQQVTIKTIQGAALKPLLESAISNEKKMLLLGLAHTRKHLAEFEREFGMSSAKFEQCLSAGEIEERVEYIDWRMEMGMLKLLESQYQALQNAQLD